MAYSDEELARRSYNRFSQENRSQREIEESVRRGTDSWIWTALRGAATAVCTAALGGGVWGAAGGAVLGETITRVAKTAFSWIRTRFGRR